MTSYDIAHATPTAALTVDRSSCVSWWSRIPSTMVSGSPHASATVLPMSACVSPKTTRSVSTMSVPSVAAARASESRICLPKCWASTTMPKSCSSAAVPTSGGTGTRARERISSAAMEAATDRCQSAPGRRPYAGSACIIRPPTREARVSDSSVLGPRRTTASRTEVIVPRWPRAAELARRSRSAVSDTSSDTVSVISRMSASGSVTSVASRATVWGRGSTDSAEASRSARSTSGVVVVTPS